MDATTKKLLLRLGIQTKDAQTAVKELKAKVDEMNKAAKKQHDENLKQASKEIAAEKEKMAAMVKTVQHIQQQLAGYKSVLQQQTLSNEQAQKSITTAKNLVAEQQHYLNILKLVPQAHDLDIAKMQTRLKIAKEEFALQEQRIRLSTTGSGGAAAGGIAQAAMATEAAKLAALQARLAQNKGSAEQAEIQSAMMGNKGALQSGKMSREAFVAQQAALQEKLHKLRIQEISQEKQAIQSQIVMEEKLGKISVQQSKLRAEIAEQQAKKRMIAEEAANRSAMGGIHAAGVDKGAGILGKVAGIAGFLTGGGLVPQMIAATAVGNGLYEVLGKVAEKMKEILTGSSVDQRLREQFEKLSQRAGDNPEETLNRLRQATQGLVTDQKLFAVSNNFLQSGIKASTAQIAELAKYTVGLSRAQGKEAPEAIDRLIRASITGRTQMVGMAVGISTQELALKGVGQAMDPVARKTLEFNHTLEVMKARYQAIGEPQLTFKEQLEKIDVAQENFLNDLARTITHAQGFRQFMLDLALGLEKFVGWAERVAPVIGQGIGNAFAVLGPAIDVVKASFDALLQITEALVEFGLAPVQNAFHNISDFLPKGFGGALGDALGSLLTFKGVVAALGIGLTYLTAGLQLVARTFMLVKDVTYDIATGKGMAKIKSDWRQFADDSMDIAEKAQERVDKLAAMAVSTGEGGKTGAAGPQRTIPNNAAAGAIQKARLALRREQAKEELEIVKDRIEQEKEATDRQYKDGLISLTQFIDQRKAQETVVLNAHILDIQKEAEAKKIELEQELKDGKIFGEAARLRRLTLEVQTQNQIAALRRQFSKTLEGLDNQEGADRTAAGKKYLESAKSIEKEGFDYQVKKTEEAFKDGETSANDYLEERKTQITAQMQFEVDAARQRYNDSQKNRVAQAQLDADLYKARIGYEKNLTELIDKELETRLQSIKQRYDATKGYLESLLGTSTSATGGRTLGGGTQTSVIKTLQDITDQKLKLLIDEQKKLVPGTDDYLQKWMKVGTEINQAYQEQVKLNQEMAKTKDLLTPVAGVFDAIASSFGFLEKNMQAGLTNTASIMKQIAAYRNANQGQGNPISDTFRSFTGFFGHGSKKLTAPIQTAQQKLDSMMEKMAQSVSTAVGNTGEVFTRTSSTVETFAGAVQTATARLMQLAGSNSTQQVLPQGFIGAPSATQTTYSVATAPVSGVGNLPVASGADFALLGQAGSAVVDTFQKIGKTGGKFGDTLKDFSSKLGAAIGVIGSTISAFANGPAGAGAGAMSGAGAGLAAGSMIPGPWGMVGGAVGGAVLGAIFGEKKRQIDRMVTDIQNSFKKIQESLQQGTITLGQAVAQVEALKQASISQLGHSKKGRQQLPSIINELNNEIYQLRLQQQKAINDLFDSVKKLSAPEQFQPFIDSLDGIIQKYKQFVSAADGMPRAMAAANQFLVLSLQQYATQQKRTLDQDYQSAVQNALQLNDLVQQRTDLLANERTQIYDIMSQGVTVRQRTQAQTKMQQVRTVELETKKQLEQLNMQIDVAQFRFNIEQKIFGLSSNRIALETELVALQEGQVTLTASQVAALQSVVNSLATMDMSSLTAAGKSTNPSAILNAVLQGLGLDSATIAQIIAQQGQWQKNFGPVTPPTPITHFAEGTSFVPRTQLAVVHRGERITPAHRVAQAFAREGTVNSTSGLRLSQESRIHSMAMVRASVEMQVIGAQKDASETDLQRLSMLRGLVKDLRGASTTGLIGADLESMIAKLYGVRGRYGAGGFSREYL